MVELRCFIAVDVTDPIVGKQIQQIQQDLRATGAQLKPVAIENLHFTLHFLGNQDESRIPELISIIRELKGEPFELELVGLGCFRPSRPRIIWLGCTSGADQLIRYQKELGNQLRKGRFPAEKRQYSPHLTIARVRSGLNRSQLMKYVQQQANLQVGKLHIDSIKLKKSTLTPSGPIYEDLAANEFHKKTIE